MKNFSKNAAGETAEKNAPFPLWQAQLANRLGISEEELRLRRDKFLTVGVHWEKKGTRNRYSDEGEAVLRASLALPVGSAEETRHPTASTEQSKPAGRITNADRLLPCPKELLTTLKVWRAAPEIKTVNLLEAYDPETDPKLRQNIKRVRVHSNLNFVRGMLLPVRHIQGDLYECSRRCPRHRGRW